MKKKIEIVLLKNVENLGNKGQIKTVSLGYYRNHLLPKHLVILADSKLGIRLNQEFEKKQEQATEKTSKYQEIKNILNGKKILFKSVKITKKTIAEKIAKQFKIKIKSNQVQTRLPTGKISKNPKKGDTIKIVLAPGVIAEMKMA